MYTIFVTGSLASGKRSACRYLAQHGFLHIDLDDMAKEFLDDEAVQAQLIEAYGSSICSVDGGVDKGSLARQAFASAESTTALNSIIWPLVGARLADIIVGKSCQLEGAAEKLVVEIPMLAEAPSMIELADATLCIKADESIRIDRALARGMQLTDIHNRMALQATDEERFKLCDVVVENNGSLNELFGKLDAWLLTLQQERMF